MKKPKKIPKIPFIRIIKRTVCDKTEARGGVFLVLGNFDTSMIVQLAKKIEEVSNLQVVVMGLGTVFVGLICIVILCKLIGLFCNIGRSSDETTSAPVTTVAPAAPAVIENRQEIIAAVSAVAAEELGTDISAIRIISFKKL